MTEQFRPHPETPKNNASEAGAGPLGIPPPNPEQSRLPSERGRDYSAELNSIRADQGRETFVADLRRNKEPLFSLINDLLSQPADTLEEIQTRASTVPLAIYFHAALREYVFDKGDPSFESSRLSDEQLQESREVVAFSEARQVAARWLHAKPDSQAARAVSVLGIYAPPDQHHNLLKEMWPAVLYFARSQSEGKE